MFLYFYNEKVDYAVVEVGLGGSLDSTNVLTPVVSTIVSISMDHMNILGDTIEEIAAQKAGVIKENKKVVLYPQSKNVEEIIVNKAKEMNAEILLVKKEDSRLININKRENYQEVEVKCKLNTYKIKLPLLGKHQILNLAAALNTIETLLSVDNIKPDKEKVERSLEDVEWKGRLEVMNNSPLVVIDGAHNIEGITSLSDTIKDYFEYDNIYLLLGILADKQVNEMIKIITPQAKKVFALTPHSERAELAENLKTEIVKVNASCEAFDDYEEAFKKAYGEAGKKDLILISGSLYMIGDMRKILRKLLVK